MVSSSPYSAFFCWLLIVIAAFCLARVLRTRSRYFQEIHQPYPFSRKLQDIALPLGMALIGIRSLLLSQGAITLQSSTHWLISLFATLAVVGGVAASRIRRFPH